MTIPSSTPLSNVADPDSPGMRRLQEAVAQGKEIPPPQEGERFVRFILIPNDVKTYQNTASRKVRLLIYSMIAFCVLYSFLPLWLGTYSNPFRSLQLFNSMGTPLTLLAIFMEIYLWNASKSKQLFKLGLYNPITLSINPRCLTQEGSFGIHRSRWHTLSEIKKTRTHLLMRLHNSTAYIIPLWAFPNEEEADTFFNEAKEYHSAAVLRKA